VFPAFETVTPDLQESGTGYTHGAFLADYCWNTVSFSHSSGEGQKHLYEIMLYLAKHHPELLAADRLLSRIDDEPETAAIRSARSLIEQGVPVENISDLEGMSRRTRAFLELTRSLGLNVYLVDTAIPFQLERVRVSNSRVREIFTTIEQRIERFDQEFDGPEFCNVRIPPLLQIALSQAQDNKKALIDEVLTLRARHRKFREYLTEHDRAWKAAETRLQRTRLHREFVNAWETIVRSEDRPRTRLIYTIWDVVKNPTKIPQAVGDILATKGRELSISSRVAGLHTFWREISQSPIPERNHRLLARLFPQQIAPDVWDSARKYYAAVDERLPKVLEPSA
jgi:hypothetical protein